MNLTSIFSFLAGRFIRYEDQFYRCQDIELPIFETSDISNELKNSLIKLENAKDMYDEFNSSEYYAEIPFSQLKEYIYYLTSIEQKFREAGTADPDISQIRFYFAKYPTSFKSRDPIPSENGKSYAGLNTFFLMPTRKINNAETPFMLNPDSYVPQDIPNDLDLSGFSIYQSFDSVILNEANLTPPPY